MIWGTFSAAHIVSLMFVAVMHIGLYHLLKRASAKLQTVILGVLSFSGIAAILFNLLAWNSPLEYLPLHLCSLNALILPIAVFSRNKVLGNLLLLWSLGAFIALVLNYSVAQSEIFSPIFMFYYLPHALEFIIPILLFTLGHIKLDRKCILSTLAITFAVFTLIHPINLWINGYCAANSILNPSGELIQVNYMFTVTPDNPLLALFYSIIPAGYWYLYLCVPVILIYLGAIYGIHSLISRKKAAA